ncbi:hypothetical protein IFR04_002497 [Cadophora malorum]|uniref:Amidoligase enzyme protein n=1 Tax=Cadophora malorum TaxID=108018 RepID=A0A8H7WGR6_9HELO|nr:hypothetical protein IFR04_002497 [Cadophora malorum]
MAAMTFGVELEFLMAFLPDDTPPPDPTKTRLLRFPYTPEDIKIYHGLTQDMSDSRDTDENGGRLICAKRHYDDSDYSGWDVVEDGSIEKLAISPYGYFQIEVRSPAYYFTAQALNEVRLACQTLTDNFCTLAVETSSLHVHVGDGERSFDFESMRRLEAFLWAFEPQLQSLHPPHRQSTYYATSLRAYELPRGALDLYGIGDIESLRDQVIDVSGYLKNTQVSICGIASAASDPEHKKKTVEWRQHEGTLDGEKVVKWIETVVGIMYFVRDAPTGPSAVYSSAVDEEQELELEKLNRQIKEIEDSEYEHDEVAFAKLNRQIAVLEEKISSRHLPLGDREWRERLMVASDWTEIPQGASDPFEHGYKMVGSLRNLDLEEVSPKTRPADVNDGLLDVDVKWLDDLNGF